MRLLLSTCPTPWLIRISSRESLPVKLQFSIGKILRSRYPLGDKDDEFEEMVEKVMGH